MLATLAGLEIRKTYNSYARVSGKDLRGRLLILVLAWVFMAGLELGSERIFMRLLFRLPAPEIGPPLVQRLLEMSHLLFFTLLAISSLSAMLSALFLDKEVTYLLGTPLHLRTIWISRFAAGAVRSAWFVLLADLPLLCAYGRVQGAPAVYYLLVLLLVPLYLVAPVSLGAAGAMLVVRWVPPRRAKETLTILAIAGISATLVGMRLLEPERFLKPQVFFGNTQATLTEIARPAAPYFPAASLALALGEAALPTGPFRERLLPNLLPLLSWAAGGLLLAGIVARTTYLSGLRRSEGTPFAPPARILLRAREAVRRCLAPETAEVIIKDVTLFWRDPAQWSQLVVLAALVVIYVFNFRQLRGEFPTFLLRDLLAFLNIGMAGFVLVAVANRFVFSSISLEGRAFWIIRSSPASLFRIVWAKGLVAFFPLLLLAETITLLTYYALGVSGRFLFVASASILLMTISVTSLGLGLGMLYPRFEARDPAEIGMSPAGLLFIAAGLTYIAAFLVLLAAPLYAHYLRRFLYAPMNPRELQIAAVLAILLHLGVVILPFSIGLAKLNKTPV